VAAATPFDGRFAWPISGKVVRGYGAYGRGRRNDGIDIGTKIGAPIAAAADGVVVYAGTGIAAYGGLILIRHNDTWTTAYGHAGELLVTRGQAVQRGQVIAAVGSTGDASPEAPHLHFEVMRTSPQAKWYDKADDVDPYPLLTGNR
jgi:murein DD-endopeptidase MepM/ murein hydrolase activator NlpD